MASLSIPVQVAAQARVGLQLLSAGFIGGTETGWKRARQLTTQSHISVADLAVMRAWFARHGPDAQHPKIEKTCTASTTGTSYSGYLKWIKNGAPRRVQPGTRNMYRGAVAWLIWGGDAAYMWLKSPPVRLALESAYPHRERASHCIRLQKLGLTAVSSSSGSGSKNAT